jgi:conflict system STAND superfamily ATPase
MNSGHPMSSPYVGLQPYTTDDYKYFFGRARDSRIISSNIFAAPLTVFYGASGVGKSSVLQAGVIPLLRKSPRTVVIAFQRWPEKDPVQILKDECLKAIHSGGYLDVQVDTGLPFDEFLFLASQAFHGTILIILDQFEEFFLYHRKAEDASFDAELARAVNREAIDVHFLISLREDSLSMLDRFRTRIPNMLGNALRLQYLDEKSAREAICKPLEVYNQDRPNRPQVSIQEDLVKVLIKDVRAGKLLIGQGGEGGIEDRTDSEIRIEAPFLQLILTRLWDEEMRRGSSTLQLGTLNALGGAGKIVRTHLDNAMTGLTQSDQEIAANIFRFLVTPSGTKIAYAVEDLAYYVGIAAQVLEPALERLAQGNVRVLRRVALPGEPSRYEIYHDVLAPAILDWRVRYEKNKELVQKRRELDQELTRKLGAELLKARENARKQRRTLLLWTFLGVVAEFIWALIISAVIPVLGSCFAFLPVGGWVFARGLRKLEPPLSQQQIRLIIFGWFVSHTVGNLLIGGGMAVIFLVGNLDITNLGIDFHNIPKTIFTIIMLALLFIGAILSLVSGPVGGFLAYGRIRQQQEQRPSTTSPTSAIPSS